MKKIGNIIELDPTKKYIMLIEQGTIDDDSLNYIHIDGAILMVENLSGIKFVENSDSIKEWAIVKKGAIKHGDHPASQEGKPGSH